MATTSLSMLDRLKQQPSGLAWKQFQDLYLPLIRGWLSRVPGLKDEADDLSQEVLVLVFRNIDGFERQREGSFRAWLRAIAVNRVRAYCRKRASQPLVGLDEAATDVYLGQLEDSSSRLASEWDREHDRHVVERLLAIVRPDFQPQTWEAFQRFALNGVTAAKVAADLKMSESAVLSAKARILKRLRAEAGIILDE